MPPPTARPNLPSRSADLNSQRLIQKIVSRNLLVGADLSPPVNALFPALAVIEGHLCQLTRRGAKTGEHAPLATAVVEFRHGPLRVYVREHPFGLLPGIANLYCLDGAFRLQWIADWPNPADPCAAIITEDASVLITRACSGAIVRLNADSGRLLSVEYPLAVAS